MTIIDILDKARRGERVTPEEGVLLLGEAQLLDLGEAAREIRYEHNPGDEVTFIIDTNPNYTNVCTIDCIFCAFYRHPGDQEAYTLTIDELLEKFRAAADAGATTVLLQGGVNPSIPFNYYIDLLKRTRAELPHVHPHFFSTSEIVGMAEVSGLTTREVLVRLKEAGLSTLPGGGAEILSDRVRMKVSHRKGPSKEWFRVMEEAHEIGYKTTATMMYGHLETDADIIEHLERVRILQDRTGGFTAFIPWSFKPGNTPLEKIIPHFAPPLRYLQILALSRIYLDNVPHIQASWFSEGKKVGQVALHFGADDFGGTLIEENVHKAARFINTTTVDETIALIREAGFTPVQRNTLYEVIRKYEGADAAT